MLLCHHKTAHFPIDSLTRSNRNNIDSGHIFGSAHWTSSWVLHKSGDRTKRIEINVMQEQQTRIKLTVEWFTVRN